MARTQHRATRGATHRGTKRGVAIGTVEKQKDNLPSLPTNALVVIACNQGILDQLSALTKAEAPIYVHDPAAFAEPEAFTGFLVTDEEAKALCEECYEELCQCEDKWRGPLVLGRITNGRFARVMHRTELPVDIPQAA